MRKGYVDIADGQLHFWSAGQGPALVLLHQAGQDASVYRPLIPHLERHHTLIVFDLPGHGQSFDPPREYDVPDYVAALFQAMDRLELHRAAVLGHHSGAVFALEMAAREPERITRAILSGMSWRTPSNTQALRETRAKQLLPIAPDGEFLTTVWRTYAGLAGDGQPADTMLEPFLVNQSMRLRPYDAHHAVLAWDREPAARAVRCPVILLQGTRDIYVTGQDHLLTLMPTARRVEIPGAGAFSFIDRPAECARVILAERI
ncbi:MAG: alpha/beta hydrolase [Rhodospirillaceae bacterium]|nr:alpha/beta hydrolase [Rhodospirillaceae bacterium]